MESQKYNTSNKAILNLDQMKRMEKQLEKQKRAQKIIRILKEKYPDAHCALDHSNVWELLVATMLSAQCTDARVNKVTPALFKRYSGVKDYAEADIDELEKLIHSTGFFKNKAKNIKAASQMVLSEYNGQVPETMDKLIKIPGVGRKTANVILGNYFGVPALTVDTHMIRLNRLLGFSQSDDAVKVEYQLMKLIPEKDWVQYTHLVIHHGRNVCIARRPRCSECVIQSLCAWGIRNGV